MISELIERDKEIERLKEELKYSISIVEHNKTIQSNINSYNKLAKYSDELEDRIDKAIEYLENDNNREKRGFSPNYWYSTNANDLLEILKGSEDNG